MYSNHDFISLNFGDINVVSFLASGTFWPLLVAMRSPGP